MVRLLRVAVIAGATLLFTVAPTHPTSTQALPMFARKYSLPCSSCHTSPPRLNEAGYAFRAAGFRMPGEIGRATEEPFDIFDYISARIQIRADESRSKIGPQISSKHQFLVQALEFYPFTGSWGKYFSSNMKVTFAPVGSPAVAIENAYGKVNAGNEKRFVGGRVGIFHPYDGYGASDNPATISRPLFQTTPSNFDQSTFFKTWGFDEAGVEVGLDYHRTSIRFALLNGLVLSKEDGKFVATAAQGGPLTGPSEGPPHHRPDFQVFINRVLHADGGGVSFYYYHGNLALPIRGTGEFFRNHFDRVAIYGSYPVAKRLHLFTGYQRGRDRTATGGTFSSTGAFAETSVPINDLTEAGVRYDWFDPSVSKHDNSQSGLTAYVNAWFYSQLRIVGEYQHKSTRIQPATTQKEDVIQVRIIYLK